MLRRKKSKKGGKSSKKDKETKKKGINMHLVFVLIVLVVSLMSSTEEPARAGKSGDDADDAGDEGFGKTHKGQADVEVKSENEADVPKASSKDSQKRDTGNSGDSHLTDGGVSDEQCPAHLADKTPQDCEVCVEVLSKAMALIKKPKNRMSGPKIAKAVARFCKTKLISTEKKMCYYFEPMKKAVAMPLAMGMAVPKVCKKLEANNPEICSTRFRRKK